MSLSRSAKAKVSFSLLLVVSAILLGCDSPEEVAENHLQKGKELFEKGEYDKAVLELKTSSQAGDQRSDTYYYMALMDEKVNNFKSMRENLRKTIELAPDNLDARQKLGKVNLLFADLDNALEQAEFVLNVNPTSEEAKLLKASVLIRQKKNVQATSIIDDVLKVNPGNIDALSLKAALAFEADQIEQALNFVNTALDRDEKNLPLRLFKIKIHAKKNNIDAVIEDYQQLIQLYPDTENFKLSLASIYSMTDKLELAEVQLRQMVDKNPGKAEPKIVLLEFLNAKAKDRVSAEFQSILTGMNGNSAVALELCKWMLASNYVDDAKTGLNKIVEQEGNSKIGLTAKTILAEVAINKKEYKKADKAISEILKENSDFIDASLLKARLFLIKNQVEDAIDLLNKAVWTKNDSDNAYMLLGQAYALKKDPKQADKNFKQALEINPSNLQAFMPIYNGYLRANQKENARQLLDKALKSKPNQVLLLTYKADLDIAEKRWDDAQQTVERIALFSKNKAVPVYLQANILQGKEQYTDAIKLYEKLLGEFPDNINSLVNLVRSYEAIKQRDKSISFIETLHDKHKENLTIVGVLSDLYMAKKEYTKAKQLLINQIKLVPNSSIPLYMGLAKVEAVLQKSAGGAEAVYIEALQKHPEDPQLSLALAGLYEQMGNTSNARKLYEKIIQKYPDNNLAINNLAAILIESADSKDNARGLELAERFKDAENVYLLDTYAWGLVKNNKNVDGLAVLESLVVKEPKMAEIRYHLGVAHLNNGNKATALVELKQSIALADKAKHSFSGKEQAAKLIKELEHR